MNAPTAPAVALWAGLFRVTERVLDAVEADVKAAGFPPLLWYDALLELDRLGPKEGLRPFELEERMLLPQYGLSRLIDRLEKAGHVERWRCAKDGRGYFVAITGQGRELRRAMWPAYAAAIERHIGSRLSPQEAHQLAALLQKLAPGKPSDGDCGGGCNASPCG